MKIIKAIVSLAVLIGIISAGYFFWSYSINQKATLKFEDFNYTPEGSKEIDELFHKGDNWYWMISNDSSASYKMDHMLQHQTSSQHEKKHDRG